MRLAEVANAWMERGVSVVPIVTKAQPAIRWKAYQARCPTLDEIHEWWGNGHPWGLAIICGSVSGNLEMTELEARALDSDSLTKIANAADSLGCGQAWDMISQGYTQGSPSGGLHMVYTISDHEVPGNEKIAWDRTGELPLVLSETRGEGGYFVGAPSPGSCHPSGEAWILTSGKYGFVPEITWNERCLVHEAIRTALDTTNQSQSHAPHVRPGQDRPNGTIQSTPVPVVPLYASPGYASGTTALSPGDAWSEQTDWSAILEPNGWTLSHTAGAERFWVRPGKDGRDGHSASTDFEGKPGFYVWSTSAGLETETPLTKLFIYAHYSFNGDMSACAKELKRRGFGSSPAPVLSSGELVPGDANSVAAPVFFRYDDAGNAKRLWTMIGFKKFRYVHEYKEVFVWAGIRWEPDYTGALEREWLKITEEMLDQAQRDDNQALMKWATKSRSRERVAAVQTMMRRMDGATISRSDMDTPPDHLNMLNGEYNIKTRVLEPHSPEHLMTRVMKAKHDPTATCPKFEKFMEDVLPDPEVRKYVQRAVGYSLLGQVDQRAFFLIYGPSGTGKSQFLSTMEYVFGNYATTAAEGTFRTNINSGPTNDLHDLMGKRLVTTSETAENANFNEILLKRLTGRDKVSSRQLYQNNVDWIPECSIWLATNHPPRFNSDDDAIWKRAKLIPFTTRFGTDVPEVFDYARAHLYAEADGILNWILAGLHDFLDNGLGEPAGVREAAEEHRSQSDSVMRFLEDQLADGTLIESETGEIRTKDLFAMYTEWSKTSGERGLGSRRFINRLESSGRAKYSRNTGQSLWLGLHRPGAINWISQRELTDNSG